MNSIESFSPPKVSALDGDSKDLAAAMSSDPSALEMLRAMMGGVVPQPPGFLSDSKGNGASDDAADTSAGLIALLTKALSDESLPASLAKVLTAVGAEPANGGQQPAQALLAQALVKALATPEGEPAKIGERPNVESLAQALAKVLTASGAESANSLAAPGAESANLPATPGAEPTKSLEQIIAQLTAPDAQPAKIEQQSNAALFAQTLVKALTTPDAEPAKVEQKPNEASLGQSILQSLGAQSSVAAPEVSAGSGVNQTPTVERVEQVSALMAEMADRVLVTDPIHGQMPEVRVKLAENIMPGTEVRVWRDDGGQLRVAFETVSPYWARVLNDASPLLAQRLSDRLPLIAPPQVIVQQQGGQPEDGRSRNRQTPWDLAHQSAEG